MCVCFDVFQLCKGTRHQLLPFSLDFPLIFICFSPLFFLPFGRFIAFVSTLNPQGQTIDFKDGFPLLLLTPCWPAVCCCLFAFLFSCCFFFIFIFIAYHNHFRQTRAKEKSNKISGK